jgi:hypothetical protein
MRKIALMICAQNTLFCSVIAMSTGPGCTHSPVAGVYAEGDTEPPQIMGLNAGVGDEDNPWMPLERPAKERRVLWRGLDSAGRQIVALWHPDGGWKVLGPHQIVLPGRGTEIRLRNSDDIELNVQANSPEARQVLVEVRPKISDVLFTEGATRNIPRDRGKLLVVRLQRRGVIEVFWERHSEVLYLGHIKGGREYDIAIYGRLDSVLETATGIPGEAPVTDGE